MPLNISKVISMFLTLPRRHLDIEVTEKGINCGAGNGLEIYVTY